MEQNVSKAFAVSDPIRDLREMDQLVYQMQTAGTPDQLRSAVARAWTITEKRMRAESDRIGSLMEAELRKAYGAHPSDKLIADQPIHLDFKRPR